MKMTVRPKQQQSGMVLIYGLIILTVISFIGVATFQTAITHERMTGNFKDESIAVQRATQGLIEGEEALADLIAAPDPTSVAGDLVWTLGVQGGTMNSANSEWIKDADSEWWEDNAREDTDSGAHYFTEFVTRRTDNLEMDNTGGNQESGTYYYRVSARAEGETGSMVVLQTIYAKRF